MLRVSLLKVDSYNNGKSKTQENFYVVSVATIYFV